MPNPKGNIYKCQHPGCNNLGDKNNWCKIHRPPKCRIERCNKPVTKARGILAELCEEHLYGIVPDPHRKTFNTPRNDAIKGWRQGSTPGAPGRNSNIETPIRETFPLFDRGKA